MTNAAALIPWSFPPPDPKRRLFLVPPPPPPADFEEVALPYRKDIFRAAMSLLRNRDEAEDLTQDVFLHAWRSYDRFEPGTNCRAWLFGILFHRVHHHRRRQSRMVLGDWVEAAAAKIPAPEAKGDSITDEDLSAALAQLPEKFRQILLLADVEEYAYREIAAMLSIPIGTVMSRLSRARVQLRHTLKAGGHTPKSLGCTASSRTSSL